jgi:Zn-dependent peptidase ImmA (M78 family)
VAQKKSPLRRGFANLAEKTAIEYRQRLSLSGIDFLPARALAECLSVHVHDIKECPFDATPLLKSMSALTMYNCQGQRLIVYNSYHSEARQESDLMHELAHVICDHKVPDEHRSIAIPSNLRSFNPQDEEEAKYMGGCLQLPREALLYCFKRKMNLEQISEFYTASLEMVKYRVRISGVERQVSYWKS